MTDQELSQLLAWIIMGLSLAAIGYNVFIELMIRKYKKKLRKMTRFLGKTLKKIRWWLCRHEYCHEIVKYYNTNPICPKCGKPLFDDNL